MYHNYYGVRVQGLVGYRTHVVNNTIHNSTYSGIWIDGDADCNVYIANNIVTGGPYGMREYDADFNIWTHGGLYNNCLYNNGSDYYIDADFGARPGEVTSDPLFAEAGAPTDVSGYYFCLQTDLSPCQDSGTWTDVSDDFGGGPRPRNWIHDMGAWEVQTGEEAHYHWRFVDGTGFSAATADDSFNGHFPTWVSSSNGPWKTIDYASSQVSADDTAWVRATTYPEQVDSFAASGSDGHRISFYGDTDGTIWADSSGRVVIDGGAHEAARGPRVGCFE